MSQQRDNWWAAVWCGLVVDPDGKHVRRLGVAGRLLLYLIVHARRATGFVVTRRQTIARCMRMPLRTVQRWLSRLERWDYVEIVCERPVLQLRIRRWKSLGRRRQK